MTTSRASVIPAVVRRADTLHRLERDYDCGRCRFDLNGRCEEPELCPPRSDQDCCATPKNGTCEEEQFGGECPDFSDSYDCGYCLFDSDSVCHEPEQCPAGTDPVCCAIPRNGVCEEQQFGGKCGDFSDHYDCGYCPEELNVGRQCDEAEGTDACPEGSDLDDC